MIHYTTQEESAILMNLGVNPNTADMCYLNGKEDVKPVAIPFKDALEQSIPCWSQGGLFAIIPEKISATNQYGTWDYTLHVQDKRTIGYGSYGKYGTWSEMINYAYDNFTQSIFKLIVWIIANDYCKPKDLKSEYEEI